MDIEEHEVKPLLGRRHGGIATAQIGKQQLQKAKEYEAEFATPGQLMGRTSALVVFPSAAYLANVLVVERFYHFSPVPVLAFAFMTVMLGLFLARLLVKRPWLGRWVSIAAALGLLSGLQIYYQSLVYYYYYNMAPIQMNVAASQPAAMYADSGIVRFTQDSRVDTVRSLGYQSAGDPERLCIAPVVDSSMGTTDAVSFFAVGTSCCSWRGHFRCDDADEKGARGALLSANPSTLVNPFMRWAVRDPISPANIEEALHLQEAVYGTKVTAQVRLLRWVNKPQALRDGFKQDAFVATVLWASSVFATLFAAALYIVYGPQRLWRELRSLIR